MTIALPTRIIGTRTVSAIGLGAMPMSLDGRPDEDHSIATIHAALDTGVTLIDTADAYHLGGPDLGHNESLVARALAAYPGDTASVLVATKGGHLRHGDGSWTLNGHADHLIRAAEQSRDRLGVDAIGLYQLHRPDPDVRIAESIGALVHLLDTGVIEMAGVSNFDPDQIREANEILDGRLASVQNQFSPQFRSSMPEIDLCHELGIAFLPWGPLGGASSAKDLGSRFAVFQEIGDAHEVSAQQVALAWELSLAPIVVPIPGAKRAASIEDSVRATALHLSDGELQRLTAS